MPRRLIAIVMVMVMLAIGACAGTEDDPESAPSPTFRRGRATIETDGGAVLVNVEVADTPELQARGLMHRESLPEDAGMVFLFFDETRTGFWMKDTLIPLSIAFFARDGEILEILDMEPCRSAECPTYDPGVAFRGALEVNQGAFEEWGVEVGDRIRVSP